MRISLYNPFPADPLFREMPYLPNGLLYIGALLKQDGHLVQIIYTLQDGAADEILGFDPDVVGISSMTGRSIRDAVSVARTIKEAVPHVPIVWGGVHPTLLPDQTAVEPFVDFVAAGEGEATMRELVGVLERERGTASARESEGACRGRGPGDLGTSKGLRTEEGVRALEQVEGLVFKWNGALRRTPPRPFIDDLDSLPDPAWDLAGIEDYVAQFGIVQLNTSRGCPFRCTFCYNQGFNKGRRAEASAARVVSQIEMLNKMYGAAHFRFLEDNFTLNRGRVAEICDLLIERGLRVTWDCESRADLFDRSLFEKMARAGCVKIGFGIESGSPRILRFIKKGITVESIRRSLRSCADAGIGPEIYIMSGIPTETIDDLELTLRLMKEIPYEHCDLMVYRPYPGTELYDYCVEQGLFRPPRRLAGWAEVAELHSAEKTVGQIPVRYLDRLLVKIHRRNALLWVRGALTRKRPLRAFLSPRRAARFLLFLYRTLILRYLFWKRERTA